MHREKEKLSIVYNLETLRKSYENEKINVNLAEKREEKLNEFIQDIDSVMVGWLLVPVLVEFAVRLGAVCGVF